VIEWVSTHRKHHAFSDLPGDPHSRNVDYATGFRGAIKALFHAHIGWMFRGIDRANPARYAKDLLADPVIRLVDRAFLPWVLLGLAFPFGLGVALTGSIIGGLTACSGGSGPHPVPAPRDVLDQLAVPLLWPSALQHGRRVAQPRLARAPNLRRGVAHQPPRVPHLRPPWSMRMTSHARPSRSNALFLNV
jgi:hypothetical protein